MNSGEVTIDGYDYRVTDWSVNYGVGVPGEIDMEITGTGPLLTTSSGPFPFQGQIWYLTGLTISSPPAGLITQRITATNKTMTPHGIAPKTMTAALPPKSRPSIKIRAPVDEHANCVPLEHYTELMAFVAQALVANHNGFLMVPDEDLVDWREWRVLHSNDGSTHTFIAVSPEVAIGEQEDPDIPF